VPGRASVGRAIAVVGFAVCATRTGLRGAVWLL
jgi:hypothetical protein